MASVVREIDALYEAGGPYGVDPSFAEVLYETSTGLMSVYVGRLALSDIRGVSIPESAGPLDIATARQFSAANHLLLLTNRPVVHGPTGDVGYRGTTWGDVKGQSIHASAALVTSLEPTTYKNKLETLGGVVHELGHTFGLRHCNGAACIMQPGKNIERLGPIIESGDPFCNPCCLDLSIASKSLYIKMRPEN